LTFAGETGCAIGRGTASAPTPGPRPPAVAGQKPTGPSMASNWRAASPAPAEASCFKRFGPEFPRLCRAGDLVPGQPAPLPDWQRIVCRVALGRGLAGPLRPWRRPAETA